MAYTIDREATYEVAVYEISGASLVMDLEGRYTVDRDVMAAIEADPQMKIGWLLGLGATPYVVMGDDCEISITEAGDGGYDEF